MFDLMKPEVRKPHRGKDFLENLAYEGSFGEDFQTYLEGLPAGTHPDKKIPQLYDDVEDISGK